MAKKCPTCKRTYPDHLPACPHCEAARAKPPTEDDLLIEDIEIVADEAARPPAQKRPTQEPLESADVHEVVEPEEVLDVLEAAPGRPDSGKVQLDRPIDVSNVPSDVLVVDEADKADSSRVKLDRPAGITEGSDVLVVDDAEAVGSSKIKFEQPIDVSNVPSDVLVVDQAEVVEDVAAAQPPPEPPPGTVVPGAVPTQLAPRQPVPTMLAVRDVAPTMLAPPEAAAEAAAEPPGAAPASPEAPEAAAPPPKRGAATHIAGRAPAPTMLADSDVADEIPASELGGPAAAAPRAGGEEAIDIVGEDALEATEASDVRPHPPIEVVDEAVEVVDEVEEVPDSGKAAGRGKGAGEEGSGVDLLGDEVLVEGSSDVELERKPPGKGERPSGVDLIAEALESGVDLAGEGPHTPPRPTKSKKRTASDKGSHVDLDEGVGTGPESSAVDLGAPEAPAKGRRKEGEAVSDVAADALLESPAEEVVGEAHEVVDEEALVTPRKAKGEEAEEVVGEAHEVVDEEVVVPKAKAKPKRAAELEEEEEEERPRRRRERAGGGFLRFVGTLLFGIILAAVGAAAVWYFSPDLLQQIPESPSKKGFKWQAGRDPSKEVTRAQLAAADLARGDFDAALEKAKGDESPDAAAVRGEARWQKYFTQQRAKNLPLKADSGAVEQAVDDLKKANAETRVQAIQNMIKEDNARRQTSDKMQASEKAIREALAQIDPKLAQADAKRLGQELEKLAGQAATLKELSKVLAEAKLLKGKSVDPAAFKEALDRLMVAQTALDAAAKQLNLLSADAVPKAVEKLAAARKMLHEQINEVNEKLQAAGVKGQDAKGVQELIADRNTLKTEKKDLDAAVTQALDELKKGGLVPAGADPKKQLVAGTKAARLKAESPLASSLGSTFSSLSGLGSGAGRLLQRGLDKVADNAELTAARIRQALSETPDQRLDTWLALYQGRARKDPQDVVSANKYLDWVNSKGVNANPETRAKALFALGLAQRNNGQFAEAARTLKQAVGASAGIKGPPAWVAAAQRALKELTDPTAYYLPRVQDLRREGRLQDALEELDTGLKAMPNDARLHAQRGLVRLDLAAGKMDAKTQELVRQDAAAAQKDPAHAAEGFYLMGRLDEQLGNMSGAEQNYRTALKTHQGDPEEASRYRSALARVLLRERVPGAEEEPAPKGKAEKTGRLETPAERDEQVAATDPRMALLALVMTGVQVGGGDEDEDPVQAARLKQATELATELIKSSVPKTKGEGYMILGQVYARQGKRGEGIILFVKGLELYYPGKESKELAKLVNEHPAFQQPDTMPRYQPLLAERHFGKGLEAFWQRRYPEAEKEFKKAVSYYDQDARYQYYLGLARYQQPTKAKRDAARYDFQQGARLEAANRPHAYQVNASLERLQGSLRQVLDRYREKAGASE
jgi:hypothetical protein